MPSETAPRTMFEKIWDDHVVHSEAQKQTILYIDLQLVHEVTSAQAFEGLRIQGRRVRRPERTVATVDHNIPTTDRSLPIADPIAKLQIDTLRRNCQEFGVRLYDIHDKNQGVVHVIGPELGLTQPGMTIVCGDSHTATHGAFGALAFGIGTSEVEHVLATQTLLQHKAKTFEIRVDGRLQPGVTAKDLILYLIGQISTRAAPATASNTPARRSAALSMEDRMTVCNMTIEAGARAGLIAPDETTFDYLRGRQFAPNDFDAAVQRWRQLPSDPSGPVRPGGGLRRRRRSAASHLGNQSGPGRRHRRPRARSGRLRRSYGPKGGRPGLGVHGPGRRNGHDLDASRPRLHRLLHQRPDRGSPRRGPRGSRLSRRRGRRGPGRARQRVGQASSRGRRARPRFSSRPASSGARPAAACAWP